MASCDLHTDSNGKPDGYWHLKQVDTLATGDIRDLSKVNSFWRIEGKLAQVESIFFLHERYSDTLRLYAPYIHDWHQDSLLKNTDPVKALGINSLNEHFKILYLSGSNMILRDSLLQLSFERY
ncbi:hypothetical protein LPYR103PRE_05500 [Segatella asaccharophila]